MTYGYAAQFAAGPRIQPAPDILDDDVADLESLRCFERAAVVLNFRLAASAVGLSPAAFGDRIRRLEDQVGERLFARTPAR